MRTLEDLKEIINEPSLISTRGGLASGGGEKVTKQILDIYGSKNLNLVSYRMSPINKIMRLINSIKEKGNPLLCAGPRDMYLIIFSFLFGKKADIYIQVPYQRSVSPLRDPVHFLVIYLYLICCIIFARKIFKNSSKTVNFFSLRKSLVILPIKKDSLNQKALHIRTKKKSINFICRIFNERGKGSKDIKSMIKLCQEIAFYNHENDQKIEINHWGDADLDLLKLLNNASNNILKVHGYDENWADYVEGCLVFLSNYEGFGLAPFEASKKGITTYVNEAFPIELTLCAPNIKILKSSNSENILNQICYLKTI